MTAVHASALITRLDDVAGLNDSKNQAVHLARNDRTAVCVGPERNSLTGGKWMTRTREMFDDRLSDPFENPTNTHRLEQLREFWMIS